MNFSKILSLITSKTAARTASDLRAALAEIDLVALEKRVDQLEERRRKVLVFGTADELKAASADLEAAGIDWERGAAAAEELKKLIANAEELEKAAAIDSKAAEARRLQHQLIEGFIAFDEAAAKLAALRQELVEARGRLEAANAFLADQGHGDLRALTITQLLDKQGVSSEDLPRLEEQFLPGYWPLPQGWMGRRPKPRPFGLARQLLAEAGRG